MTDELNYLAAVGLMVTSGKGSTSYIQRTLALGYNAACRLVERMEDEGILAKPNNVGKREVLLTAARIRELEAALADASARADALRDATLRLNAACDAMWNDYNRIELNPVRLGPPWRLKEVHMKAISEAQQALPAALAALTPTPVDATNRRERLVNELRADGMDIAHRFQARTDGGGRVS